MNHKIRKDNVLLLPIEVDSDETVLNPRQYEDKPEWGVVMDCGEDVDLETGDVVVYGAYASTVVRSHGIDFFFVRDEDIMSVAE